MKRKMIFAVAVLMVACTKNEPCKMQEVVFYPSCVRSGEMTKTTPGAVVGAVAPSGMPTLTITSTTNTARVYQVKAGDAISLPLDTYKVTGRYSPASAPNTTASRGKVYKEPSYSLNSEITISEGQTSYSVPTTYTCFALVVDFGETEKALIYDSKMNYTEVADWVRSENYGIIFVSATTEWNASMGCTLIVQPVNKAEYEDKSYKMVTSGTGGVLVENGKWYCFSPSAVDTEQGSFTFTFPEWEQGSNESN